MNDEQHDPEAAGRYHGVPAPGTSWGGEYDGEATAFVQLPPSGPDGPYADDPLAAPGHGYRPPEIGTAAGPYPPGGPPERDRPAPAAPPPTVGASTDPAATGSWALPFATEPEAPAAPAPPPAPTGDAAAMGQGAAAALAGVHQGRGRRRPLGGGPGAEHAGPPPTGGTPPGGVPATGAAPHPAGDRPAHPEAAGRHHPPHAPGPDERPAGPGAAPGEGGPPGDGTFRSEGTPPADAVPPADGGLPADAVLPADAEPSADPSASVHPTVSYVLRVNGIDRPVGGAWIGESLLHVLRERLGLAGAKDGCSQGECGACSVQVDGRLVVACLVPAATAAGSEIRTVEGLSGDGTPSDVQRALAGSQVQCGFCLPGMAMTVHDLLEGNHDPTERETRQALCGNLCRCSGYRGVLDAVRRVARERADRAAAEHDEESAAEGAGAAGRIPHQGGPYDDGPSEEGPYRAGPPGGGGAAGGGPSAGPGETMGGQA